MDRSDKLPVPNPSCPVHLMLTHVDCTPGNTLVSFQGQYVTICELDYKILQVEIQNAEKTRASVEVGELCLVEDVPSNRWFRGRVQDKQRGLFDVFLLDYGNVLTVSPDSLAVISDALLMLPPKIVCGFFADVLPVQECWDSISEKYFSSLLDTQIIGYIHALLPYGVLILQAPKVMEDILKLCLGRHVDTDTFLLLMEMLLEVPIQKGSGTVLDSPSEKQTAQEFPLKSSNFLSFLSFSSKLIVGQKARGMVTAAVNPGLFYCQLSSAAKDLKEMSDKLSAACKLRSNDFRDKAAEILGLLCAVKGKDEKWHRGFVECLPVNSQIRVGFVDYGYCESVNVENILQLPPGFLQTPVMAFPCSLTCLSSNDNDTKNQQLAILMNALLGKELVFVVDGFSKEKNVFSVTISSVDPKMVNSDELSNIKREHIFNFYPQWCTDETKRMKTFGDAFPCKDIQDGSMFEGYVEHVQSPKDFWIRTAERNEHFEDMMKKLTTYFSAVQLNEEILDNPEPGELCCAMYEQDLNYYRAVVVDILEKGAEVFFIDFGNTERVPGMLIKRLPSEFAVEAPFAFNCSLAHVASLEDCWTVKSNDFFRRVTSNKKLLVHVLHKRSDAFVVELYEKNTEKCESIAALMARADVAEYWTSNSTVPVEAQQEKNNIYEKKFDHHLETMPQKPDCKEAVVEKQALAEASFRKQKFKPGSELSVVCSHVTSPSDFWCQNKKQKDDLDRLMEKLQDFYATHCPVLQPHSVCCAIKFQDDRWYRGRTIGVKNEEVGVIMVDYGIVVKERLKNIRALMPEFLELEEQAFQCSLYNLIEPAGEMAWSKEACELLNKFVSGASSDLICKIYSQLLVANKGLYNVVDLQTPLQWASEHLVEKGVAKEIKCPKQLVSSAYPYSFVYSSFNINIGSEELVYATNVVSPWEIYLQLDRNCATIDKLIERTTKESEELLRMTPGNECGSVCLARYFGDGKWYRCHAWPSWSSQHLNLFFVDYGNKEVTAKHNVFTIPRKAFDLLLIPMQALRCCLCGIPEEEHLPEVNEWLRKTIINTTIQAKFIAKDNSGHFFCDLFDGNTHINKKVKELLATLGQKDQTSDRTPISDQSKGGVNMSSRGNRLKKMKECRMETMVKSQIRVDCGQTGGVRQENRQYFQRKPSKFSCRINRNLNNNFSKENKNKEIHNLKHKRQVVKTVHKERCQISCTITEQSPKVLLKISDLPNVELKPNFREVCFISHCHSPDKFFIQKEKDEQTILKIEKDLNSNAFTANLKSITSEINVGDLVVAKYEDNLALYRAVVISVESGGVLTVEFVDYGNTATVKKTDVYLLTSQFMSHGRLSTPCVLSEPHRFEDTQSFIEETQDKPLMVMFLKNLGYAWEVCIKILHSLNESRKQCAFDVKCEKVPALTQCKSRQELNATENMEHNHISFSRNCETTKAEASGMKVEAKKIRNVTQPKRFERNQRMRVAGDNTAPQESSHISHASGTFVTNTLETGSMTVDAQDFEVKECRSVLGTSTVIDTSQENHMDKEDQVQHLSLAPVKEDFEYSGYAAEVTTPGDFSVVLEPDMSLFNMISISSILEDLPEVLSPLPETHLTPGAGCLVKSQTNKWCRAEIVQCDDLLVILNLVDYGHYAHCQRQETDKLKMLPVELLRLPKITYQCLLRGIKPASGNQWSDNAIVFFQECMYPKNLQIYFKFQVSDSVWEVDVLTEGRYVAQKLVDAGHANYIDSLLLQHDSSLMSSISEVGPKQTHWEKKLPQGYLEAVSLAQNAAKSNEEMPQNCGNKGMTEHKRCVLGPGQMTHYGSRPGFKQCMLL